MRKKFVLLLLFSVLFSVNLFKETGYSDTKRLSQIQQTLYHDIPFIPLMQFTQHYGFKVIQDNESKVLTLSSSDATIKARIDSALITINDRIHSMGSELCVLAGECMIPYHFVSRRFPEIYRRIEEYRSKNKFVLYEKKPDFVVVLDPGHGGNDPGAIGPDGTQEKDINLDVGLRIARRLKDKGIKLIMTRDRDYYISLQNRVAAAVHNYADLFISIHANSAYRKGASGIEIFYPEKRDYLSPVDLLNGIRLAQNIDNALRERLHIESRGIKSGDYHVLRNTGCPALLIEVGFLTNTEDLVLLKKHSVRDIIADVLADTIIRYYKQVRLTGKTAVKEGFDD